MSYYDILEVEKEAKKEDIRNQYKKLAAKYHPDNKEEGNEKKYTELSNAYETLSDPEKRKIYDKHGEEGLTSQQYEPQYEGQKKKCKARVHFLHVNLEDIFEGSHLNVEYSRKCLCKGCDGTGTDNPAARRKCPPCEGKGEKIVNQRMGMMLMQNSVDCTVCEGSGWQKNEFICEDCNGARLSFEKKSIKVDIEKGSPDGYRFTFFEEGDQKPKCTTGDLLVELVIKKNKYFKREGADIWYRLDLSLLEAITGFKKIIPTLNGMERLEIETEVNEIVQSGEVRVIVGRGLPFFNNPKKFGNMFVEFNVVFPSEIKEEKLLQVEKILSERIQKIPINEEKKEDKELYFLTKFKPEEANISVSGGKSDNDKFKYAYNQDEEEDNYDPYGGHSHHSGGQRCQYQ